MKLGSQFISLAVATCFLANNASAEQKIVWAVDSYKLRGKTTEEKCQRACNYSKFNAGRVEPLLAEGWKVVSSSSKEIVCIDDWSALPTTPIVMGCTGIGTQYILQKEEPVPPKAEAPNKEMELLKKETELLKQEIALLKQENDNLKSQLKSKHKNK